MRVGGFSFKKISVEKNKNIEGKVNINLDIKVNNIEKTEADLFKEKIILSIDFSLKIEYQEDIARLIIDGIIILIADEEKDHILFKKTIKNWKNQKLNDELRTPLFNAIFRKCNIKALELEDWLNLPYHIPSPRFTNN